MNSCQVHQTNVIDHGQYKSRIPIRIKVPMNSINDDEQPPSEISEQIEHDSLKRVKFCKTEIHFTAESGRVAIVETDTKPPSATLHRRRDRSYRHTYLRTMHDSPGIAEVLKDSSNSINLLNSKNSTIIPNLTNSTSATVENNEKTTTTTTTTICSRISLSALNNPIGKSNDDLEEDEEDIAFRGILKNKLIKPKSYHFGENIPNCNWGVQLKPTLTQNGLTRPIFNQIDDQSKCLL